VYAAQVCAPTSSQADAVVCVYNGQALLAQPAAPAAEAGSTLAAPAALQSAADGQGPHAQPIEASPGAMSAMAGPSAPQPAADAAALPIQPAQALQNIADTVMAAFRATQVCPSHLDLNGHLRT
jgi:hypothetical protein